MMRWSPWLTSEGTTGSRLSCFVAFCWAYGCNSTNRGNQYSTIRVKLAGIRWYHRYWLGVNLSTPPRLQIVLRGVRRLSEPLRKKQPLTPAFLRLLRRGLNLSRPRQRLLWGSVLLGYFFLLRRSEYLMINNTRHAYCLKSEHVFFSDDRGARTNNHREAAAVTIGLAGAKNDQYGRGSWRTMHKSGDPVLCPVRALRHIRRARLELNSNDTHLCGSLGCRAVTNALKQTARRIGVPDINYSTHSIRIGGATALISGGADGLSVKLLGRWMSNCYAEYPVQSAAATRDLARRMV